MNENKNPKRVINFYKHDITDDIIPDARRQLDKLRRLNNALLVKAILARIALDPRFHP